MYSVPQISTSFNPFAHFPDCLDLHHRSGAAGLFALWVRTLFDWFKTVIEEQLNRTNRMTRTKLVCFWFPFSFVMSLFYEWISGGGWLELPSGIDSILMTLSFASLLLLGFEVQRRQRLEININGVE